MNTFAQIVVGSVVLCFAFIVWMAHSLIQAAQYEMALWFSGIVIVVWLFTMMMLMASIYGDER